MLDLKYRIISAFPGVGKTFSTNNSDYLLVDSDSSLFPKENDAFPSNYISHIRSVCSRIQSDKESKSRVGILISTHDSVRNALTTDNIPFSLVYPDVGLKSFYMDRYERRGSPASFLSMMDTCWTSMIESCVSQKGCRHYMLTTPEQSLLTTLPQIL